MASGSIVGSYIGGRLLGLVPSVVTLPALAAILLSRLRPMTRGVVRGGPDVRPLPGFPGAGKGFLGGAGDLLAARRTAQTALGEARHGGALSGVHRQARRRVRLNGSGRVDQNSSTIGQRSDTGRSDTGGHGDSDERSKDHALHRNSPSPVGSYVRLRCGCRWVSLAK